MTEPNKTQAEIAALWQAVETLKDLLAARSGGRLRHQGHCWSFPGHSKVSPCGKVQPISDLK